MNAIPSYIPSNISGEEILAMLRDCLPLEVCLPLLIPLIPMHAMMMKGSK